MGLQAGGDTGTLPIYKIIYKKAGRGEDLIEGFEDLTDDQLVMEIDVIWFTDECRHPLGHGPFWIKMPPSPSVDSKDGFLLVEKGHLSRPTDRGRLVLDELSSRLSI